MGCVFLIGLALLWKKRSGGKLKDTLAMTVLWVLPFLFACAGAIMRIHPYGHSRHTVFLAIFMAVGIGVALERLFRFRMWAVLPAMAVLIPLWHQTANKDPNNIGNERHQRGTMLQATEYIRNTVGTGSLILADGETKRILNYYLRPAEPSPLRAVNDGYHLVSYRYTYGRVKDFIEDVAKFREQFDMEREAPVWAVDGGWYPLFARRDVSERFSRMARLKHFGNVLCVIRMPPDEGSVKPPRKGLWRNTIFSR